MANTGILADGYFDLATDPDEGDFAQGLEDIVSLIKEAPGGTLRKTAAITLASDAFAPVKDYCAHIIDTQSAAATDDLVTITATGVRDGFIISISIANSARVVTVKNSGNITTLDGNDLVINSTAYEVWFRWDNTLGKWRQITNQDATIRLNKMPGGLPSSALTISGGSVTATRGFHTITSEAGVTDDLDLIAQTTLSQDTTLLMLKATTGHTITVRHNQSGTGKIITPDGTNLSLTGNRTLILAKNGSQWDVIGKLGSWVANIGEGGTNNGSLGVSALGIYAGDGSKITQITGTAGQQFRVKADGTGVEAFSASTAGVQMIVKPSDESVDNTNTGTTLQDDNHLTVAVSPSTTYKFFLTIFVVATSSPDIKFTLVGPSGSTIAFNWYEDFGDSSAFNQAGGAAQFVNMPNGTSNKIVITGSITVGGTAGNLTFQFAQNTANASPTTVKQGSSLLVV